MHHGQAGLMRTVEVEGVTYFIRNDVVCSNALVESSAAPKAASTAQALGPEPSCAPASPAVMKPKSYAAVVKASVVTTAPPQPAAVLKLSAAASMPSTDLKPSVTVSKLAADTTSLKVNICMCSAVCMCMCMCACACACVHEGGGGGNDHVQN